MKKHLLALAAMSSLFLTADTTTPITPRPQRPSRRPATRFFIEGSGTVRYPEQSNRQALRGQRRAQGGPGLHQMKDGAWVSRNTLEAA